MSGKPGKKKSVSVKEHIQVTYLCNGETALYAIKATGTFGKV